MHSRMLSVLALITLFTAGLSAVPAYAGTHPARVAPADEYFGRLKMSILGVRNELRDLSTRLRFAQDDGSEMLGSASMVEDALRDWERKYPQDPWLAKSIYDLSQVYGQIRTDEGQRRARSTRTWLIRRYPRTLFARTAREQMAIVK